MMRFRSFWMLALVIAAATVACSGSPGEPGTAAPVATDTPRTEATSSPGQPPISPTATTELDGGRFESSPVALPVRPVTFRVRVPDNTPPGDSVYVMLHAADVESSIAHVELQADGGGIYSGDVDVPDGGLVRYAYDRWDEVGCCEARNVTRESLFTGDHVGYRLLAVEPGLQIVEDVVPRWNDLERDFEQVDVTGRVIDAETLEPLMDVEVTVGGVHVASRYNGSFTVPGIVPGTHRVVAYTVKGDYSTAQIEITVTSDGVSDLEIALRRAETTRVEFVVKLPPGTPGDAGIFIAGNLRQLGARPSRPNTPAIPSGIAMPELSRRSDKAVIEMELPIGAYVEYFYTLGSDTAAEGADNNRLFRSFVVPSDEVRFDDVQYWGNADWPLITMRVTVPLNTPHGVPVYLSSGPTYRMRQAGPYEYVTAIGSHPPGSEYTYSISLGDDMAGTDGSPGLDEPGIRSFTVPDADAEFAVNVTKWSSLPDLNARDASGGLTVKFRLSVPPGTPGNAVIVITGDRPALGANGTEMTQVPGNPWLYEADVRFGHDGQLRYRYTVADSGFVSDELSVATDFHGQEFNDYVVSWSGGSDDSRDGWISGIYTPDFWSEAFLPSSASAFEAAVEANGEWVAISSVWSFGQILPAPFVESRPVRKWTVLTPIDDIREQAAIAREAGLKVFLAPQMNPEVHQDWQAETVSAGSRNWWGQWLEQAEAQWMWNAVVAEEIGAEMLLLPGYVFHVFPPTGFFTDPDYAPEFDLAVQAMIKKVRDVYSGKILISGSQRDYDFPGLADYVGVTTYDLGVPELPAEATFEQLDAFYVGRFEQKVDTIWERWDKPVFFYTIHAPAKPQEGDEFGQLFQAAAYESLFQQIAARPFVIGSLSWAFDMIGASHLVTEGVRDRVAGAVMAKWYARLTEY